MSVRWTGGEAAAKVRRGGEAGLMKAARLVMQAAQANAPVRSGALRAAVSLRADGLQTTVCFTSPHALPVHEGTRRMRGRPFLRDALQRQAQAAIGAIAGEIEWR